MGQSEHIRTKEGHLFRSGDQVGTWSWVRDQELYVAIQQGSSRAIDGSLRVQEGDLPGYGRQLKLIHGILRCRVNGLGRIRGSAVVDDGAENGQAAISIVHDLQ